MKYIPGLNGLRAIAVFFVIFYHWGFPPLPGISIVNNILPNGKFGVELFFVISGFLISSILLIEKENHLENPNHNRKLIVNFYIRRSLRIFPVYYLTLFVLYFCNLPQFKENLPFYLTYTENFNVYFKGSWDWFAHSWSLSVEEQFYLIWPFVIIFTKKSWLLPALILFTFSGTAFSIFQTKFINQGFNEFVLTPTCFDAFGTGALLAYFYTENKMQLVKKWLRILLPVAVILFFYWKFAPHRGHFQYFRRFFDSIISCGLITICLTGPFTFIQTKVLENKVMYQLGKVSYGIYLFHYPLPFLYTQARHIHYRIDRNYSLTDYTLMMLILLSLAFFSYYLVEKPILNFKTKFQY
jgi:peptidoglycan/LPS O-acetylase OafA/YrhL